MTRKRAKVLDEETELFLKQERDIQWLEEDMEARAIQAELVQECEDGHLTDYERNYPWHG